MNDLQRAALPTWECYDLVSACSVGRMCFLDGDTPIVYPVSFKLHRTDGASFIVVRTGSDSLMAKHNGPASFEVDNIDVDSRSAWSVLFRGVVRRSHETADLPIPDPWVSDDRHVWLLMEISTISGRRFVAKQGPEGYAVEWELDATAQGPEG